jgi:hypothetical protein
MDKERKPEDDPIELISNEKNRRIAAQLRYRLTLEIFKFIRSQP